MTRRLIHFSAGVLRLLAIAMLLAVPVVSGIAYAVAVAKNNWVHVFGVAYRGQTSLDYVVFAGAIRFDYSSEWAGTSPPSGVLCDLSGLDVRRDVSAPNGATSGYVNWQSWCAGGFCSSPTSLRFCWPCASRGRCCGVVLCPAAVPCAATTFAPRLPVAPSAAPRLIYLDKEITIA